MIHSIELTEHHGVIKKLLLKKIPGINICDEKNIYKIIRYIRKTNEKDHILLNTFKHDLKTIILMMLAKLYRKNLIIGIHSANQLLSREYIKFNEYKKESKNYLMRAAKYLIFRMVNDITSKTIRKNFEVLAYSLNINDYIRKNGFWVSDLSQHFFLNEVVKRDIYSIKNKSKLILYGRLDEQRIDLMKFKGLIAALRNNELLSLKIISNKVLVEFDCLKGIENISVEIKKEYDYEWLLDRIQEVDYIIDITKKEKFSRAMNYEKYDETIISGLKIDALLSEKAIAYV